MSLPEFEGPGAKTCEMIRRCSLHQLDWNYEDRRAQQQRDGLLTVNFYGMVVDAEPTGYWGQQYLAESQ